MFVLKPTDTPPIKPNSTTNGGANKPTSTAQPTQHTQPKHGTLTVKGKRTYTDEEKRSLLVGYVTVPQNKWDSIPYKAHIRYVKADGTFIRGGFMQNYWTSKDNTRMMQISSNLNRKAPGYITWAVPLNGITTLYKKVDKGNAIEVGNVYHKLEVQRTTINNLVDVVNQMDKRIKRLETMLKK